jgi:hypothetical protein
MKGKTMGKIVDYVKATSAAADVYKDDVAELIAAGENKATAITVPNDQPAVNAKGEPILDKEGKPRSDFSIAQAKRAFQNSARLADRTARLVSETDNGDGTTDLVFVLAPKIVRAAKSTDEETAPDAEYPGDSAAATTKPAKG